MFVIIIAEKAMRGVDYVFHAAALKQVPSCEFFPLEATKQMHLEHKIQLTQQQQIMLKKLFV